jgi:hypothetical protein
MIMGPALRDKQLAAVKNEAGGNIDDASRGTCGNGARLRLAAD